MTVKLHNMDRRNVDYILQFAENFEEDEVEYVRRISFNKGTDDKLQNEPNICGLPFLQSRSPNYSFKSFSQKSSRFNLASLNITHPANTQNVFDSATS